MTASIIIGSVPAVIVGAFLSSRAPDKYIRPAITFVIFASGLKYAGLGTTALGWVLCATLLGAGVIWLAYVRPWRTGVGGDPDRPDLRVGDAAGLAPISGSEVPVPD